MVGWLIVKVVRERGLEPPLLTEPDPKSGAAANYATRANLFTIQVNLQIDIDITVVERPVWDDAL